MQSGGSDRTNAPARDADFERVAESILCAWEELLKIKAGRTVGDVA